MLDWNTLVAGYKSYDSCSWLKISTIFTGSGLQKQSPITPSSQAEGSVGSGGGEVGQARCHCCLHASMKCSGFGGAQSRLALCRECFLQADPESCQLSDPRDIPEAVT